MAKILKFPKGFLWGASTSAHQVEGGNANDWSQWEQSPQRMASLKKSGKKPADYISGRACGHYEKYEEDFDLAKKLNHNAHRLSIEWSRIEPEEGRFNEKEIEHYKKVIASLRRRKIEPLVTLWHYTHPLWFSEQGGWLNPTAKEKFLKYVEKVVSELKDEVKYWITENEPETVARNSYLLGTRPPQMRSYFKARKVLNTLIEAHNSAYNLIHSIDPRAQVGCSESLVFFETYGKSPLNWLAKTVMECWRNNRFIPRVARHSDFIGLQYYFHSRVRINPIKSWKGFQFNDNKKVSDMGWEIYPEGIYHVLMSLKKYNLPVIITENGIADHQDKLRADFIKEHLFWVHKAMEKGIEVQGYIHWSLMDNFEWESGFWPRFGLIEVDYKTLARKVRPSAKIYAEICKSHQVIIDK